jgi:hypothetical protein
MNTTPPPKKAQQNGTPLQNVAQQHRKSSYMLLEQRSKKANQTKYHEVNISYLYLIN